jgi:magnesium chelatase family protein
VLFLDECPEFRLGVLDALRQPLESGVISIARAAAQARYPARFQLVLAANPCPCGMAVGKGLLCTCPPMAKRRYLGRLSGPLLDRVDLRQNLVPPSRDTLSAGMGSGEGTAMVAARVHDARARMAHRYRGTPWLTNADRCTTVRAPDPAEPIADLANV